MYLYSINIDLCTSNYHIRVIDIRSYTKDSYHTTSQSQATLLVGVHPVTSTASPKPPTVYFGTYHIPGKGLSCIQTVFYKDSKDAARVELESAVNVHFKWNAPQTRAI